MVGILKFVVPFFHTPANYAEVLQKLAVSVFWETYIITFFLRDIPMLAAFRSVESEASAYLLQQSLTHMPSIYLVL